MVAFQVKTALLLVQFAVVVCIPVPGPPTEVVVSPRTSSVTLTVTLPTNCPGCESVIVNYSPTGDTAMTTTSTQQCDQQPCNIPTEDLTAGTCYSFTVYTRGSNGNSTTGIHTTGCTQPNPPGYVSVNAQPTYAVTLDTTSPATGGVDYYNVTFTDSDGKTETRRTPTNDTLYIVDGLTPGYIYTFKVVSVYNSLASIPYQSVPASTVPSSPSDVTVSDRTTTSVTLTVNPGPGGYDGYRVQTVGGGINTTGDRLVVSGLIPGTTFTITVFTQANGLESKHFYATQDSTIPNPPDTVAVNNQTTSTVTLDITSPSTGGVDSYNFTFTDTDGKTETRSTPNNDKTYTVDRLTPGYSYTFKVISVYTGLPSTPYQDIPASTVPAVPTKVGYSTTNDSISVTLTSPAPGYVDNYIVSEDCASSGNSISPAVTISGQTVTIGGLSPGTTCSLTVIAVFDGHNSSAAVFSGQSIGDSPTGRVGDLSAQTLSATAIGLTWKKPTEPNGDIIQYSVYVTDPAGICVQHVQLVWTLDSTAKQDKDSCKETMKDTFIRDQLDFNKTINDLLAYTRYTFRVYAYTDAGRGLESSQASNTSESEPYKITDLTQTSISSSRITISFKEPEPSTGPITTYEVQYVYTERVCYNGLSTGVNITHNTNCTPSSGRTVCSIENLYPYWDYSISVRAYNSIGSGYWSDPLLQKTAQDKPSSIDPNSIKPTVITAYSVTLEWSAPCPPNGVISNYVILWNMSPPINTSDNSSSYLVSGLLSYRTYTYQIAAETGAGIGNYSTDQSFTTLTDGVLHLRDILIVNVGQSSLELSFVDPNYPSGLVMDYEVQYTYLDHTCYDVITSADLVHTIKTCKGRNSSRQQCTFVNLFDYWRYSIIVRVITLTETGNWSNPIMATTEDAVPGIVDSVTMDDVTPHTLTIKWSTPCFPNGVIINYVIRWDSNATMGRGSVRTYNNETVFVMTNLRSETAYLFWVEAVNSKGVGKSSALAEITTLSDSNGENVCKSYVSEAQPSRGSAAVPVLGTLLALSTIANLMTVIYLIRYRRSKPQGKADVDNGYEVPESVYDQLDSASRQPANIYDTTSPM